MRCHTTILALGRVRSLQTRTCPKSGVWVFVVGCWMPYLFSFHCFQWLGCWFISKLFLFLLFHAFCSLQYCMCFSDYWRWHIAANIHILFLWLKVVSLAIILHLLIFIWNLIKCYCLSWHIFVHSIIKRYIDLITF